MVWRRSMIPELPAEGILKQNSWGDSKLYKVVCECGSNDCDHNVWVEAEDTGVTVTIYTTTRTNFWSKTRWYHIWTLLTKGYIDTEANLIMKKQVALNYANVLQSAINEVERFREKYEQNKNS
jgi:hypothetical protein